MAAFDWYQATVRAAVDDVLGAVMEGADGSRLEHRRGLQGYGVNTAVLDADGVVGHVWHGGTHAYPHVVLSGERAQGGAELIRAAFPEHFVVRADAREDFGDEGAFDRMQPVLLDAAREHRIKVGTAGDHLLTKEGRTVYLGSPKSPCRLRMYDKAAELRAKFEADPVRLAEVPRYLTRVEAQVRPETREARARFATIEPVAVMGSSAWLRHVWRGLAGLELEPVQETKPFRQADDDRAWAYLLAQYGGLLARRCEDLGSWACVGLQLGADLAEREEAERRRAR